MRLMSEQPQKIMSEIEKSRLTFARALLIIVFLSNLGGLVAQIYVLSQRPLTSPIGTIVLGFFLILCAFLWVLLQRGNVEFVTSVLVLFLATATLTISLPEVGLFVAVLGVIATSTLINNWVYGIATGIILSKYVYEIFRVVLEYGIEVRPEGVAQVLFLATLITLSISMRFLIGTAQRTANQAQRNAGLLRATADVSEITSRLLDLNEIFTRSVNLIRERFGYYHVQIFLIDENREYANLVASTGEVGQMLLERKHRLAVGSTSVIGRVTQIGQPVLASDTDSQSVVHARNELLPNTRAELAVAITDGERIIGALDVQSTEANAFYSEAIQALETVANQIGTAIRNARLFEAQTTSLQENKRLFFESEASLREIQRLNREMTRKVWSDYLLDKRDISGILIDKSQPEPQREVEWTPRMLEASQRRRPSISAGMQNAAPIVAVPIVLRGEVIGAIEVQPSEDVRQDDTIEVAQAVAQRLALSLDNARLFEETQRNAQQQQAINEIVGKFQSATDVDDLLQMTLTQIGELIGAQQGAIRLGSVLTQSEEAGKVQYLGNGNSGNHSENGGAE